MKFFKRELRFGAVLFSAAILQFSLSAAEKTSVPDSMLLTLENKVEVALAGQAGWLPARTNQILHVGDRVRTGARSRATIRLSNLTVLRVYELTMLQIHPPSQPEKSAMLDLQKGAAYFLGRERPTEMEFRTPVASGAIRGTEFHLDVAENGTTRVTLIDGAVELKNEQAAVELASGEEGIVEPGKAPRKTAFIEAINIIQWCLYYPAVLNLDDLNLAPAEQQMLAASLDDYRSGDLLHALANYPANRIPNSDSEKIYLAQLLLAVGQVMQAEEQLKTVQSPLADALQEMIAAVKHQTWNRTLPPTLASEWMAESYYQQSRADLVAARKAAQSATEKSPNFGFAFARLAEMEFSFGHVPESLEALEKSLQLSPRNAQALALKGFLLAAQNKISEAQQFFNQAIAVDGALGNAWLGRGLIKIRQGQREDGVRDLQTAAVLEPQRSVLRSYLGKAFNNARDNTRAHRELGLGKKFDPNDPTPWLYSALLDQEEHRFNEGIRDLEKSQELNDNRRVYRSQFLLDQDRAVRSASLAAIYRDAGMTDVSVREASRAVTDDYANYSAHLFLANSFDQLRDRTGFNLRYETVWFNELLLANLLAPVGAGTFSQNISQQEYSRLFDVKKIGLTTTTTVRSDEQYHQEVSQFGTFDKFSYSLDLDYQHNDGVRPNNELDLIHWFTKLKFQLTPQDTLFLLTEYRDFHSGDNFRYYSNKRRRA
ncbi:MAG: FecR domain-containing protein [Verrucomicrobiota bacterium]